MISTGTLMLGKALLTAAALLGFCIWQLLALRKLRRQREENARRKIPVGHPNDAPQADRPGYRQPQSSPTTGQQSR